MRVKKSKLHGDNKILIDITGPQGNAYHLIGVAQDIGKKIFDEERTQEIIDEMKSGDYENLLTVFENYFGSCVIILE